MTVPTPTVEFKVSFAGNVEYAIHTANGVVRVTAKTGESLYWSDMAKGRALREEAQGHPEEAERTRRNAHLSVALVGTVVLRDNPKVFPPPEVVAAVSRHVFVNYPGAFIGARYSDDWTRVEYADGVAPELVAHDGVTFAPYDRMLANLFKRSGE